MMAATKVRPRRKEMGGVLKGTNSARFQPINELFYRIYRSLRFAVLLSVTSFSHICDKIYLFF